MKDVPQPNDKQTKTWARYFPHLETWWEHECEGSVSPGVLNNLDGRKVSRLRTEVAISRARGRVNPTEAGLDFVPSLREGTPHAEHKQRELVFVVCWNQLSQQEELYGRL